MRGTNTTTVQGTRTQTPEGSTCGQLPIYMCHSGGCGIAQLLIINNRDNYVAVLKRQTSYA
jgi:hypothetical protein